MFISIPLDKNKVSPSKGALLIKEILLRVTFAFGKDENSVKSASSKSKVAVMLLFTLFLMISEIFPFRKKGAVINTMVNSKKTTPTIVKIFFFIYLFNTH
jgi:hypothetical protein